MNRLLFVGIVCLLLVGGLLLLIPQETLTIEVLEPIKQVPIFIP